MADPEKISMVRKFIRRLARRVATVVKRIDLPAHLSRLLYEKLRGRRLCWIVVAVVAVGFIILLAAWLHPARLSYDYWRGDSSDSRSEVFRNFGLVFAAFVAGALAVWRSRINERQAYTAEQGQITDRYYEAVKMLSTNSARTRTGAVYALARIAQDSIERDHIPVMEVLAEFIRNPHYRDKAAEQAKRRQEIKEAVKRDPTESINLVMPAPIQCPDIHAALNVIADRNDAQKAREKAAAFRLHFFDAALLELKLGGATFTHANLSAADLSGALLAGADLSHATLYGAYLDGADLDGADLTDANLTHAQLNGADLSHATLYGANLTYARLQGAYLTYADLTEANLTDADLSGANLFDATLTGANLAGAVLLGAVLFGAVLIKATGLTQKQIDDCEPSAPPFNFPDDLDWPFVMNDRGIWVQKG